MGMRTRSIEARAVRHIWDIISITDLYDLLNLFGRSRHNDAPWDGRHDTLISQTAFITTRSASIGLAYYRIVRDIFRAYNGF
jgi:hypothetical protein